MKIKIKNLVPFSHGCCDNIIVFGRRRVCRCNDYVSFLPMWKKLVQASFGVHRENDKGWGVTPHQISGWRLSVLKFIIKPTKSEASWRWIKTPQKKSS